MVNGQLIEYDSKEEDLQSYIERMKQYFAAYEITAARRKSYSIDSTWYVNLLNDQEHCRAIATFR